MFRGLGRAVVRVDDLDQALTFYRDVLGFEVLHDSEAAGFRYLHVGLRAQEGVGLWLFPAVRAERDDQPLLVLYTDDLDGVRSRLVEQDVEIWADRSDEGSRSLHFRDVAGNVLIAAQLDA